MPITVKHGEGLEGLAALVALMGGAGQQRTPQAPATGGNFISFAPGRGGGGGGGGSRRGGGGRGGPVAPPGEPTKEEQLRMEMQMRLKEREFSLPMVEEEARIQEEMEAEGWELQYSAESRKDMAKWNDSLRKIRAAVDSGSISPEEGEAMSTVIRRKMLDVDKSLSPPDPNKPKFEPGPNGEPRGIGDEWVDDMGNKVTRNEKGIPVVQVPFDKTQEGLRMKYDADLAQKGLEAQQKRQDAWLAAKQKLLSETVSEKVVGGEDGEEIEVPKYSPRGADAFLERVGYTNPFEPAAQGATGPAAGPTDEALEQELRQRVDARGAGAEQIQHWLGVMKATPTEAEAGLPDEVAMAQAFLRESNKRLERGEEIFPHVTEAYDAAIEIMEEYNARGNR